MASYICPGYMGLAEIGGNRVRCTDFNINPTQDALFYDHVIGLNDTIPGNSSTKGENIGSIQTQKRIWRPSPILINGGISFPATEGSLGFLFEQVKYGKYFDMSFKYYRGNPDCGRKYSDCRVNSFTFTATAADIVTLSAEITALSMEDSGGPDTFEDAEKLITWDKVDVSSEDFPSNFSLEAFNFAVNNNVTPIYTVQGNDGIADNFLPKDLRVGMQEVTGDLTFYRKAGPDFLTSTTETTNISVSCPGLDISIKAVLKPRQIPAAIGPVITTVPFIGVDKAFGD